MRYAEYLRPSRIPMRLPVAAKERGLVLYMPMVSPHGNILQDFSGYGNHGTIHGATWTDGKFGKALYFDGEDDYVEIPDDESLDITDEITIEAWVKLDSSWSDYGHICTKRDGTDTAWQFYIGPDRKLGANGGAYTEDAHGATQIPTEQWTHVTVVITGNTFNFYVNGNFDATDTATALATNSVPVSIGARFNGYPSLAYPFVGTIDEVRIYNRALSEEEIKAHYLGLQYLIRG